MLFLMNRLSNVYRVSKAGPGPKSWNHRATNKHWFNLIFFLHCFMSFGGNFVLELLYQEVKQTKLMISSAQLQRHAEIRSIVSQSSFWRVNGIKVKSRRRTRVKTFWTFNAIQYPPFRLNYRKATHTLYNHHVSAVTSCHGILEGTKHWKQLHSSYIGALKANMKYLLLRDEIIR